jgi:hypothetical protein
MLPPSSGEFLKFSVLWVTLKMEEADFSEMLRPVPIYQITRRHIREGRKLEEQNNIV